MFSHLRVLTAAAVLAWGVGSARAAPPQQMILFKQTARIGPRGGRLIAACGYELGSLPGPRDRYTHFTGNIHVTPVTNGVRGKPVSLPDAIHKHDWLKITGGGSTSFLSVAPTGKLPNTVFDIEVPKIERGATSRELLDSLLAAEKTSGTLTMDDRVGAVRDALHVYFGNRLPPSLPVNLQRDVIWGARSSSAVERARAATSLRRLEDDLKRLKEDTTVNAFAKSAAESRQLVRDLAGEEETLTDDLERGLGAIGTEALWGSKLRQVAALKFLGEINGRLKEIKKDPKTAVFFKDAATAREEAAKLDCRPLETILRSQVAVLMRSFTFGGKEHRESSRGSLAALLESLKQYKEDPGARAFLTKAKSSSKEADSLPLPELKASVEGSLESYLYRYTFGDARSKESAEKALAALSAHLARLKGDGGKRFRARIQQAQSQIDALQSAALKTRAQARIREVTDQFIWGPEKEIPESEKNLEQLSGQLNRWGQKGGQQFFATLDRLSSQTRALPPFSGRDEVWGWLRDIGDDYAWRDAADQREAARRLEQLDRTVQRLQQGGAKQFLEQTSKARTAVGGISQVSVRDGARNRLNELERDYVWGSEKESRQAQKNLEGLDAAIERLGKEEAKQFFDKINEFQASMKDLPLRLRSLTQERLTQVAQEFAWGSDEARIAARRNLELFPEQMERLKEEKKIRDFVNRVVRESEELLNKVSAEERWQVRRHWRKHLQDIQHDYVWGTDAERAAAEKRFADFKADFALSAKRFGAARSLAWARPVFKDNDSKVFLAVNGVQQAPKDLAVQGKTLVVDGRGLSDRQFEALVKAVKDTPVDANVCIQLSEQGLAHVRSLPGAENIRLLGDSERLEALPPKERPTIMNWLEKLAAEWNGRKTPRPEQRLELIVDHFDGPGGMTAENLKMRIQRGDFRGKHLILMICNTDFAAFHSLSRLALTRGGALSVTFPRDPLQASYAPLVVEAMRAQRLRTPTLSPAELVSQATRAVRMRLERCSTAANKPAALRAEFASSTGDAVKLFERNGVFEEELLAKMIRQLRLQEKTFGTTVRNETPKSHIAAA